jgi:adenine-specific DNA-methyltransferase
MELYAHIMARCYLITPAPEDQSRIRNHIQAMNTIAQSGPYQEGIICKLYAPKDTASIQEGERCFYTRENALIIDTLRKYIDTNVEPSLKDYCLAPLLNRASIHTNTAGVFKGFYKDGTKGHFGGKGENALTRILKPICLDMPLWNTASSAPPFTAYCFNKDINALITELPSNLDLIYLDPPYNQHPYGSNYFMLNVIATNKEPPALSKVSGIPIDWNKSTYNKYESAVNSMKELLKTGLTKSRYILLSYNNEGIITTTDWEKLLAPYTAHKYEITYDAYKGSRNLESRPQKVMEIMYLITTKS